MKTRNYFRIPSNPINTLNISGVKQFKGELLFDRNVFNSESVCEHIKRSLSEDNITKQFTCQADKKEIESYDMALINRHTVHPLKEEDIEILNLKLCNNLIDRDKEKFSMEVLNSFAKSIIGKTFLLNHSRDIKNAIGIVFKSSIDIPRAQEDLAWLNVSVYILKEDSDLIKKVKAGIFKFVSIGFTCPVLEPITKNEKVVCYEYKNLHDKNGETIREAEALECSLVWLGAQYNAEIEKSVIDSREIPHESNENNINKIKTGVKMEKLLFMDYAFEISPAWDEDKVYDEIQKSLDTWGTETKLILKSANKTIAEQNIKLAEQSKSLSAFENIKKADSINEHIDLKLKMGLLSDKEIEKEKEKLGTMSDENIGILTAALLEFSNKIPPPLPATDKKITFDYLQYTI